MNTIHRPITRCQLRSKTALALSLSVGLLAGNAGAANDNWNVLSGTWDVAGNWDGGVPTGATTAVIANSGTALVTAGVTGTDKDLFVGSGSGNVGTLQMSGGLLGSSNSTQIGKGAGATGLVTVSGGTWNTSPSNNSLDVGLSGTGTINLTGGLITSGNVGLGENAGGLGLATVSGGTWNIAGGFGLVVGDSSGVGALAIANGGLVHVDVGISLGGLFSAGTGTLTLSGTSGGRGVLETTEVLKGAGGTGTGKFIFDGGILRALGNGDLFSSFSTGNVTINAGDGAFIDTNGFSGTVGVALTGAGGLTKQGEGVLALTGANTYGGNTLVSTGTLVVGSGVSLSGQTDLQVGDDSSADAFLLLSGGSISVGNSLINGGALVSGGTWNAGALSVTGIAGFPASLEITGGVVAASSITIAPVTDSTGAITVDGGKLTASGQTLIGGRIGSREAGSLTITSGTFASHGTIVGNRVNSSGTITMTGGLWTDANTVTVGNSGTGALEISGGEADLNNLIVGDAAGSQGTVNLTGAGVLSLQGGAGELFLGGLSGANGTLNIGSGTIPGGTLNAIGVENTGSGTATVNFNFVDTETFAPEMDGNMTINKLGTGTLVLTANNNLSGATHISAGTLQTQNAGALGADDVNLSAGATLRPTGGLTGLGSLTLRGGTIVFDLNSSAPLISLLETDGVMDGTGFNVSITPGAYTSGTYNLIDYASTTLTLAEITLNPLAGYTLTDGFSSGGPNSTFYITLTGSGGGSDLDNGGGTPTGSNFTVTDGSETGPAGVTNFVTGLVFAPDGSLNLNGPLVITNGLFDVPSGTGTMTGTYTTSTPGDFTKLGQGLLKLLSNVFVAGNAYVQDGILSVDGVLTARNIIVNAILKGHGFIVGNVTDNGIVAPGNSPGTLTVVGNYTQSNNGTLQIEVASTSLYDKLIVSGHAQLAGVLQGISYAGYKFQYGQQFAFLQANGGISGNFSSVTMTNPSKYRGRFLVNGNTGSLLIAPTKYELVAQNQNQTNVAKALDSFIPATSGDKQAVSIALDLQNGGQYENAFNAISPAFYESLPSITIEQINAQNQMLAQRMSAARFGLTGFSVSGLDRAALSYDRDGKGVMDAKSSKDIVAPTSDPHWGVWVQGNGIFSKVADVTALPNYRTESGGFLTGVDYRWNDNFITGVYGGYQYSYSKYANGGSNEINGAQFGGYATYHNGGLYSDAMVGGGYSNYTAHRSIQFSTIDRMASSTPDGGQFNTYLDLGYDWNVANFTFGPIVSGQYTYAGVAPFTENGADSLDLRVNQENTNSLQTSLGGRVAYHWQAAEHITITPEVRMFWQHEYLRNSTGIGASLDGGSGPGFNFATSAPARDAVFAGAGFSAEFGQTWNAYVYYNADFGRQDFLSSVISTGLEWKF